jgi:hypothetical protein
MSSSMFRNHYSPAAHPNLSKTHDGTPQNFASRKGQGMLNKTMVDEPICMCMCVLRILIAKDEILPFSNYNVRIHNLLQKFAAHLKPCGGTPIAKHWSRLETLL